MRIIPALYIQNGKLISFYKGAENPQKKTYPKSPKTMAEDFRRSGSTTLFVVDVDGDQSELLPALSEAFEGEIWWAGKVRDLATVDWLFNHGANRVVLGWSAKPIFKEALDKHGSDKILAGLQLQHYEEIATMVEDLVETGFENIVVKDLNAEGTLFHPNFDLMEKAVYFSGKNIYASGGISEERHLRLLEEAGVKGAIVGRALYEHKIGLT